MVLIKTIYLVREYDFDIEYVLAAFDSEKKAQDYIKTLHQPTAKYCGYSVEELEYHTDNEE